MKEVLGGSGAVIAAVEGCSRVAVIAGIIMGRRIVGSGVALFVGILVEMKSYT